MVFDFAPDCITMATEILPEWERKKNTPNHSAQWAVNHFLLHGHLSTGLEVYREINYSAAISGNTKKDIKLLCVIWLCMRDHLCGKWYW